MNVSFRSNDKFNGKEQSNINDPNVKNLLNEVDQLLN